MGGREQGGDLVGEGGDVAGAEGEQQVARFEQRGHGLGQAGAVGDVERRSGRARRAASATRAPSTPGSGSSLAAYTSVTTTRSAPAASAWPNSWANSRVREYRWGWNTATTRFHGPSLAAARVAATLGGLWA